MTAPRSDLRPIAFVVLAFVLPLGFLLLHRSGGHEADQQFFFEWKSAICGGLDFYASGPGVNYPILGAALTAAPSCVIENVRGRALDFSEFRDVLKVTIAIGEVLFIFGVARIAATMKLGRPRLAALAVYLVPSSWAGGAFFGQIDPYCVACLLFGFCEWLTLLREPRERPISRFAVGATAFTAAILIKQLAIAAMPVAVLLAVVLLRHRRITPLAICISIAISGAASFLPDLALTLPNDRSSHLAFIFLDGGSAHADILSGAGANVWSLLPVDMLGSAHEYRVLGVSAFALGIGLFVASTLAFAFYAFRAGITLHRVVLLLGTTFLLFSIFMTGVHERYVLFAAPWLLLAALPHRGWNIAMVVFATEVGIYAVASLYWDAFSAIPVLRSHVTAFIAECGMLIIAVRVAQRLQLPQSCGHV